MAGRRECKDARTVRAIEDRVDDVMNMWRRLNMFYEHIVHEPELRELDMSLALECLAGLARRRSKAYNRRAGREKFLQLNAWRMQLCDGRSKLRSASVERKPSRRWEPPD